MLLAVLEMLLIIMLNMRAISCVGEIDQMLLLMQ